MSKPELYLYTFASKDENGNNSPTLTHITDEIYTDISVKQLSEQCVEFLKQTTDAYIDKYNIVHEIYNNIDQLYGFYFHIRDNDWYELTGHLGQLLDEVIWTTTTEFIRKGIEELYNIILTIAEGNESIIQE